ncbi:MAG: CpaF family protein [Clostridiaceae bacterium]|nr:CpaF family protein [Clostridiaceae bacterium]
MTEKEKNRRCQEIRERVYTETNNSQELSDEEILEMIEQHVLKLGHAAYLSISEKKEMTRTIFHSLRKLDILQDILEDPTVTEIMVNGPDHIFVERYGRMERYEKSFSSKGKLDDVIQQIVAKVNRMVNEANPIADVRLLDGSRVNVVLPPVAINGPIVTIRKFPETPISMDRLLELGSITEEAADFLRILVRAKYNIFISGGTGSGKTTFLNALSDFIPSDERIITVEDSAELQLQGIANLVRLEVRNANLEGKHEISIRDLIRCALRMRPDRIILGEVRDAAACDLLSAMNTGHDGSLSTGHANSPKDMLGRLETLVLTGMDIPLQAVRSQIASAIDIVIQLGRLRDRTRKVLEIDEVVGLKNGEVHLVPLYCFLEKGQREDGSIIGGLVKTEKELFHREKLLTAGLAQCIENPDANNLVHFSDSTGSSDALHQTRMQEGTYEESDWL